MAIDDRIRDGLRRAAEAGGERPLPEHLWVGIGKGIRRARHRQAATLVATIAFSLVVFAGIMTWVVLTFTGSSRQPADHGTGLSVQHVRLFGTPTGLAKIYGTVANHGRRAVGAQVMCQVFDASGHSLGTAAGSLPYIPAGSSAPFGPFGGEYSGTPSSARCNAAPIPPVAPSPSQAAASAFHPTAAPLWNARGGILAGPTRGPE